MSDDLTDRRGLLRSIAARVASGAREAIPAAQMRAELTELIRTGAPPEPAGNMPTPLLLGPQLTDHRATEDELARLVREAGLERHADAARRLSRPSVRLAPEAASARSTDVPGASSLPAGASWPEWNGTPLTLLLELELAGIAAASGESELPTTGALGIFFSVPHSPSGLVLAHGGGCKVVFRPDATWSRDGEADRRVVRSSGELMLPRVWAEPVQALGLDDEEQASWQHVRVRLAELQGVKPFDVDSAPRALHRALGWPDERSGWMPLACALLDAGVDVAGHYPSTHPLAAAHADRAGEWRLLLQLTADRRLGWNWGPGKERLYIWIKDRDLADHDFSRVRTIVP